MATQKEPTDGELKEKIVTLEKLSAVSQRALEEFMQLKHTHEDLLFKHEELQEKHVIKEQEHAELSQVYNAFLANPSKIPKLKKDKNAKTSGPDEAVRMHEVNTLRTMNVSLLEEMETVKNQLEVGLQGVQDASSKHEKEVRDVKEKHKNLLVEHSSLQEKHSALCKDHASFVEVAKQDREKLTVVAEQLHTERKAHGSLVEKLHAEKEELHVSMKGFHLEKQQLHVDNQSLRKEKEHLHTTVKQLHIEKQELHKEKEQLHTTYKQLHLEKQQLHAETKQIYSAKQKSEEQVKSLEGYIARKKANALARMSQSSMMTPTETVPHQGQALPPTRLELISQAPSSHAEKRVTIHADSMMQYSASEQKENSEEMTTPTEYNHNQSASPTPFDKDEQYTSKATSKKKSMKHKIKKFFRVKTSPESYQTNAGVNRPRMRSIISTGVMATSKETYPVYHHSTIESMTDIGSVGGIEKSLGSPSTAIRKEILKDFTFPKPPTTVPKSPLGNAVEEESEDRPESPELEILDVERTRPESNMYRIQTAVDKASSSKASSVSFTREWDEISQKIQRK